MAHAWPGNVRELRNVADRFVLGLYGDSLHLAAPAEARPATLPEQLEHFERTMIGEELRRHHGDVALSAKSLGVPKQTLYDKLRRLRMSTEDYRQEA
jgi:two-component system C4-dicarboxylate transport response regulator DctD